MSQEHLRDRSACATLHPVQRDTIMAFPPTPYSFFPPRNPIISNANTRINTAKGKNTFFRVLSSSSETQFHPVMTRLAPDSILEPSHAAKAIGVNSPVLNSRDSALRGAFIMTRHAPSSYSP